MGNRYSFRPMTAADRAELRRRPGRRNAWDHVHPARDDRGDFDDAGRSDWANHYHAAQKHRRGTL